MGYRVERMAEIATLPGCSAKRVALIGRRPLMGRRSDPYLLLEVVEVESGRGPGVKRASGTSSGRRTLTRQDRAPVAACSVSLCDQHRGPAP